MSKHQRINIQNKPVEYGNCPDHPDRPLEFYCLVCQKAICVNCKFKGSHSGQEQANHAILDIEQAYQEAKSDAVYADNNFDKKKKEIRDWMHIIEDKQKKLTQNV